MFSDDVRMSRTDIQIKLRFVFYDVDDIAVMYVELPGYRGGDVYASAPVERNIRTPGVTEYTFHRDDRFDNRQCRWVPYASERIVCNGCRMADRNRRRYG